MAVRATRVAIGLIREVDVPRRGPGMALEPPLHALSQNAAMMNVLRKSMPPRVPLHALSQQHTRAAAGQVHARHVDVERRVRHDAVRRHGDDQVQALHVEAQRQPSQRRRAAWARSGPGSARQGRAPATATPSDAMDTSGPRRCTSRPSARIRHDAVGQHGHVQVQAQHVKAERRVCRDAVGRRWHEQVQAVHSQAERRDRRYGVGRTRATCPP
ncbi:hypothetical protein M885DRAFT_547472, partial [Pelagophyceae sp. CCMP2097]